MEEWMSDGQGDNQNIDQSEMQRKIYQIAMQIENPITHFSSVVGSVFQMVPKFWIWKIQEQLNVPEKIPEYCMKDRSIKRNGEDAWIL
jgi:hypothetical protein